MGQLMSKAMHRLDPAAAILPMNIEMSQPVRREQRRPYVYSDEEIQRLLKAALAFPSPKAPLRPLSLYTMVVLAYCAGLRLGEIVRSDIGGCGSAGRYDRDSGNEILQTSATSAAAGGDRSRLGLSCRPPASRRADELG